MPEGVSLGQPWQGRSRPESNRSLTMMDWSPRSRTPIDVHLARQAPASTSSSSGEPPCSESAATDKSPSSTSTRSKGIEPAIRSSEPSRYHVDEISRDPLPCGHTSRRWGVGIKRPDGTVVPRPRSVGSVIVSCPHEATDRRCGGMNGGRRTWTAMKLSGCSRAERKGSPNGMGAQGG